MNFIFRIHLLLIVAIAASSIASAQMVVTVMRSPLPVQDAAWIDQQCLLITDQDISADVEQIALLQVKKICEKYEVSPKSQNDRDTWILEMLQFQDNVGEETMRKFFMPTLTGVLPVGLESYSLFLFPDDSWKKEELAEERQALLEKFISFGQSIGDEHAAVWFEDDRGELDILRSRDYSDKFELAYEGGPYIVFINVRPDLYQKGDENFAIRLGGITTDDREKILDLLAMDIRSTDRVREGRMIYEEVKARIFTLVSSTFLVFR